MQRVLSAATACEAESPAINYYEAAWVDCRWVITRRRDGHVFCICRSRIEAEQLAKMMNRDCARDPKHHGG